MNGFAVANQVELGKAEMVRGTAESLLVLGNMLGNVAGNASQSVTYGVYGDMGLGVIGTVKYLISANQKRREGGFYNRARYDTI